MRHIDRRAATNTGPTRRRFIAIAASMAAATLAPRLGHAALPIREWRGVALGAQASIRLAHADQAAAIRLLERCAAEITRLERIFSLYLPESDLSRLNRAGVLEAPSFELVELLGRAAAMSAATGGVFDVTVQPLWRRYAEHFATAGADPAGPATDDLLPLVDWRAVEVGADRIALGRRGMAVTLNGIAQGYITDRVAALLRGEGMEQVLIDLGETRAIGSHPDGRPWRVGIADPGDPTLIATRLDLTGAALATSGGYGTPFDAAGRANHLIDPRNGGSAPAARSISVIAAEATTADAASTAFALMPIEEIRSVSKRIDIAEVHVLGTQGHEVIA